MPGPKKKSPAENMSKHVVKGNGCWRWVGAKHPFGYGWLGIDGKGHLAHRVSYEIHYGKIPPGKVVRHACDNPECTNPEHLLIGEHADNVEDKISRGRHMRDGVACNTKFTRESVARALDLRKAGMYWTEIARSLGVSRETIRRHMARV